MIVTLTIDDVSRQYFDALRKEYFPAHANYVDAHLTLFHALQTTEASVAPLLTELCKRRQFNMKLATVNHMDNGVAYGIESEELQQLHARMQQQFESWLVAHDRQPLKPHITIQNKVTAFKALGLFKKLQTTFEPFEITATGLSAWEYMKGPWKHVGDFAFL